MEESCLGEINEWYEALDMQDTGRRCQKAGRMCMPTGKNMIPMGRGGHTMYTEHGDKQASTCLGPAWNRIELYSLLIIEREAPASIRFGLVARTLRTLQHSYFYVY